MTHDSYNNLTKRKVVFLSRLYAPHIGGVEHHISALSHELTQRNDEITVVTEQFDANLPLDEKIESVRVIRIPKEWCRSKKMIWSWMVRHVFLFMSADLIHAHDVFWWYLPLRLLLFWKPVYTTFHGYEGSNLPTKKAIRSRKVSEKLSWGTICVGDWMRRWYGAKPSFVVYGAANARPKNLIRSFRAVFVGRLSEDTGILEYVHAVLMLRGKVTLDIYGEGDLLEQLRALIRDVPYILYKGVAHDPLAVLAHARFAFVSRYLGMIEAMQIGRYVCAQWNNNIKKDYVLSFPGIQYACVFSDASELVRAIQTLSKKKEEDCVRKAQIWAMKQRWSTIADTYEALWSR